METVKHIPPMFSKTFLDIAEIFGISTDAVLEKISAGKGLKL
jgi:hypothetical protein